MEWKENLIELNTGKNYVKTGVELKKGNNKVLQANNTKSKIKFNNKEINVAAYNINNNNYFKLRDICSNLNVGVDYDNKTKTIVLDTSKKYVEEIKKEETVSDSSLKKYEDIIKSGKIGNFSKYDIVKLTKTDFNKNNKIRIAALLRGKEDSKLLLISQEGKLISDETIYMGLKNGDMFVVDEGHRNEAEKYIPMEEIFIMDKHDTGYIEYTGAEFYENKLTEYKYGDLNNLGIKFKDSFKVNILSYYNDKEETINLPEESKNILIELGYYDRNGKVLLKDTDIIEYSMTTEKLSKEIIEIKPYTDKNTKNRGMEITEKVYAPESDKIIFKFKTFYYRTNESMEINKIELVK